MMLSFSLYMVPILQATVSTSQEYDFIFCDYGVLIASGLSK